MAQVPTAIFRKDDIRGMASGSEAPLSPAVARRVGQAYGTVGQRELGLTQLFVGGDNRLTTPPLKEAIIEGLLSTGLNVSDLGGVMTPTVYFASAAHPNAGGIMVTGSHLPTEYNGIKLACGAQALAETQFQALIQIIQTGDFSVGQGERRQDFGMARKHLAVLKSKIKLGGRKIKLVLDAGNGLSGSLVAPLLRALGVEMICLYCEPDGTFPNHLPNPDLSQDLQAAVVQHGADFGIAFDGDADCCGLIDEHGHPVAMDHFLALLARDVLARNPGAPVVFDARSSQVLPDTIRASGGQPVMWTAGHGPMSAKMREIGAPLGGDLSGHLFIGENYYGFEDAPLAALKALELYSKSDRSFSQLLGDLYSEEAK